MFHSPGRVNPRTNENSLRVSAFIDWVYPEDNSWSGFDPNTSILFCDFQSRDFKSKRLSTRYFFVLNAKKSRRGKFLKTMHELEEILKSRALNARG